MSENFRLGSSGVTSLHSHAAKHNGFRVHFGLGRTQKIDAVEVRWPSGLAETFPARETGRYHTLQEGQGAAEE